MPAKRRPVRAQSSGAAAAMHKRSRKDVGALFGQAAAKDEEIWSSDDEEKRAVDESDEEVDVETAQEKKVRYAWKPLVNCTKCINHCLSDLPNNI